MYQRILELNTEREANELKEYLEINYIPCIYGHYIPYQGNEINSKASYFVSFSNEYNETYDKLDRSLLPSIPIVDKKIGSFKKSLLRKFFVPFYVIVISILCLKFYYQAYNSYDDKHIIYKWSIDNKVLNSFERNSGERLTSFQDKNYNNNWERMLEYKNGNKILDASDTNENGVVEEYSTFNLSGELVGVHKDINQDRLLDTMKLILENKHVLIFVDENRNGQFEILK